MTLLSPILIRWGSPGSFSDPFHCLILFKIGRYLIKIPNISRVGGTMRTISIAIQFGTISKVERFQELKRELSICWRPEVTWYYLHKTSYLKYRKFKT